MNEIITRHGRTARVAAAMCSDLKLEFRNEGGGVWKVTNPDNGHHVATLYKTTSPRYTAGIGGRRIKTGEASWNVHVVGTPRATCLVLVGDTFASAKKKATEYVKAFVQDDVAEAMMPQFKVIKSMLAYREAVKPGAANPWRYGIAEWYDAKLAGQKIQFKDGVWGTFRRAMNCGFNGIEILGRDADGEMVRAFTIVRG